MTGAQHEAGASKRVLAGLMLVAVAVRSWRWGHTDVIFADGPRFLEIAQAAGAGEWGLVFADDFHPLYPLLIALVQPLVGDWELAAALVSIASAALTVYFLHELVRLAFGATPAWIACAMFAVHPTAVDFSSDVQSEGLYLAGFIGALYCGWRMLDERSGRWALGCGCLAGISYLVRPEGVGVAGIIGVVAMLETIRGALPFRRLATLGGGIALGVILAAAPYVWVLSDSAGSLTLTRKKSVAVVLGLQQASSAPLLAPPSAPLPSLMTPTDLPVAKRGGADGLVELARKSTKAMRYEILLLLGIGLWSARGRPSMRGLFFLTLVGGYGVVLFGLFMSAGYISRRHCLPVLIPLFGYAALGVPLLGDGILRMLRLWRLPRSPGWATAAGLLIVAIASGVQLSGDRAQRHLAERRAGERVALSATRPLVVAAHRRYGAYYAGARYLPIQPSLYTLNPTRLRERGATHVILHETALDSATWDQVLERPGLRVVDRFEAEGRTTLLIEVEAEEASGSGAGR